MHGRRFKMFKLRTMVNGAHKMRDDLMHLNEVDGPVFKIRNDPRTHPLGRFLRRTSIDELPNLVNVVLGDMSLVGPRPALPSEVEHYDAFAMRRLTVPQGLTCLWQINGRSERLVRGVDESRQPLRRHLDAVRRSRAHRANRAGRAAEGRRPLSSIFASFPNRSVRSRIASRSGPRRSLSWGRRLLRPCWASCAKSSARSSTAPAGRWTRFWRRRPSRRFCSASSTARSSARWSRRFPNISRIVRKTKRGGWRAPCSISSPSF